MSATVLGRGRELASVQAFLEGIADGGTGLVLEGEAGIGKTTVWVEAITRAVACGFLVLRARPDETETSLAVAALVDLLQDVGAAVLGSLPTPQRGALEAALLRTDDPVTHDRRVVSTALVSVLRALSDGTPVVVDDVQWLDRPSAAALEFAARRLDDHRVGLLVTARTAARGAAPLGLDRTFRGDRLRRLRLGPLSLAAICLGHAGRVVTS